MSLGGFLVISCVFARKNDRYSSFACNRCTVSHPLGNIHDLYWNIENTLINLVVIFVGGSDEHSPLLHTAQPYPGRSPDYWVRIFRPRPGQHALFVDLNSKEATDLGTLGGDYSDAYRDQRRGAGGGILHTDNGQPMPSSRALMA